VTSITQENILGRGDQKVCELLIMIVEERGVIMFRNYTICIYHRIMDMK